MAKKQSKRPISSSRNARPGQPVAKKARVEVTFEGESSTPQASSTTKTSKPASQATSDVPTTKNGAAEVAIPQNSKGKGKALDHSPSSEPLANLSSTFIVIAGSYEKLLYGLEGSFPSSPSSPSSPSPQKLGPSLEPIFIFPAHLACVKAIAASPGGKWLATGSEDEFIKVWDLRRRKEVGSLSQHSGSITSLHFPTSSHLISTSVDGTLSLFRTSDWALLKSLKGHSGRVNYVDVHPTGRVALSVGKDNTLRMWDLMRGRGAASLPLEGEAEMVKFSPLGTHFAVLFQKRIEVYSLTLKLLGTLSTKGRFNTMLFALLPSRLEGMEHGEGEGEGEGEEGEREEVLCVGTEKGLVEVYSVDVLPPDEDDEDEDEDDAEEDEEKEKGDDKDGESSAPKEATKDEGSGAMIDLIGTLTGHTNRIKSISALEHLTPNGPSVLLSTVSSDGLINVYDIPALLASETNEKGEKAIGHIASYDTKGSRLTCVYLAEGKKERVAIDGQVNGKRTADVMEEEVNGLDEEDEDESEGEDIYEQDDEDQGSEDDDGAEVEIEDEEDEEEEELEEEDE